MSTCKLWKDQNSLFSSDLAVLLTQLLENSVFMSFYPEKCGLSCRCQKFRINVIFVVLLFGIALVQKILYCRIYAVVKLFLQNSLQQLSASDVFQVLHLPPSNHSRVIVLQVIHVCSPVRQRHCCRITHQSLVINDKISFLQYKVLWRFPRVNARGFKTALHFSVKENLYIPYGEVSSQQLFPARQRLQEIFHFFSSTAFQNSKTGRKCIFFEAYINCCKKSDSLCYVENI